MISAFEGTKHIEYIELVFTLYLCLHVAAIRLRIVADGFNRIWSDSQYNMWVEGGYCLVPM